MFNFLKNFFMKNLVLFFAFFMMVFVSSCDSRKEIREPLSGTSEYQTYYFSDQPNLIGVKKGDKKVIIPNEYQNISYMGDNFVCKNKDGYHLISKGNTILLSTEAPFEYNVTENYYMSKQKDGRVFVYLPENGNTIVSDFECFVIDSLNNLCVFKNKKYGIINKEGSKLILPKHEALRIINGKYIALDAKKDGTSIYNEEKEINWKNVKITAYSPSGKVEKNAPSIKEVQKHF